MKTNTYEASRALKVTAKTLLRYAHRGCPHIRVGPEYRFDPAHVRRWMTAHGLSGKPGRPLADEPLSVGEEAEVEGCFMEHAGLSVRDAAAGIIAATKQGSDE